MKRSFYMAAAVCAAVGIGGGTGLAAQSPRGQLGPPTSVTAGSGTGSIIVQSTAACAGFASGDTLTFSVVTFHSVQQHWDVTPDGPPFLGLPANREIDEISGAAGVGGWTYTLRGHYDSGISTAEDFVTTGKAKITRSDGRKLRGDSSLLADHQFFPNLVFQWLGTPTCT